MRATGCVSEILSFEEDIFASDLDLRSRRRARFASVGTNEDKIVSDLDLRSCRLARFATVGANENIADLPPFPPMGNAKLVPTLHHDLANEPYTSEDTGYRPELKVKRPFFSFKIDKHSIATCSVNNKTIISNRVYTNNIPYKSCTNISVVNVYDTYGLDMTYSFLYYVYHNRYSVVDGIVYQDWLKVYLGGSLIILQPDFVDYYTNDRTFDASVLYMCTLLMTHFITMETNQAKLNHPIENPHGISVLKHSLGVFQNENFSSLRPGASTEEFPNIVSSNIENTTHVLPLEIIAKITNSGRISKKICNSISCNTSCDSYEEISNTELKHFSNRPYTTKSRYGEYYQLAHKTYDHCIENYPFEKYWYINNYMPNSLFSLIHTNPGDYNYDNVVPNLSEDPVVAFSIFDYLDAFNRRKASNGTQRVVNMLQTLSCLPEQKACAWLVQLAYDTEYEYEDTQIENSEVLYSVLSVLVDRAIAILTSIPPVERFEAELDAIAINPSTTSLYQDTIYLLIYRNQGIINEWSLCVKSVGERKVFALSKLVGDEIEDDEMDGFISRYSIYDYVAMYSSKGMNGNRSAKGILLELLDTNVDSNNYKNACSWVVQLSYDSKEGKQVIMNGYQDLKTELDRLIHIILPKLEF